MALQSVSRDNFSLSGGCGAESIKNNPIGLPSDEISL